MVALIERKDSKKQFHSMFLSVYNMRSHRGRNTIKQWGEHYFEVSSSTYYIFTKQIQFIKSVSTNEV